MNHQHKFILIGYFNGGWGISTDCPVHWCAYCGSIRRWNKIKKIKKK